MNANDVIESYITDVALRLPRRLRNDVAFELRALLQEELQGRADSLGETPDAATAIDLVRKFGRPEEVAARYRPTLTIIDPSDGHRFVRATVIGLAILWSLGLLARLNQPMGSLTDVLRMLGQWWTGTVLASLWWPGLLVIGFGLAARVTRDGRQRDLWKPRDHNHIPGGRSMMMLAIIGIACGLCILIDPRWLLDVTLQGRAAPAAYDALTYTETFRHRQAAWLLGALLLNLPLFIAVIVRGRWTARLRQLEMALSLLTCALMLWAAFDGPIFVGQASDRFVKALLVLITLMTLANLGYKRYRAVKPMPGPSTTA